MIESRNKHLQSDLGIFRCDGLTRTMLIIEIKLLLQTPLQVEVLTDLG